MSHDNANFKETPKFDLGFENDKYILPGGCKNTDVVLLEGPPGTFKKTIALNFLVRGLVCGENVLLIELAEGTSFVPGEKKRVSELTLNAIRRRLYVDCVNIHNEIVSFVKKMKPEQENSLEYNAILEAVQKADSNWHNQTPITPEIYHVILNKAYSRYPDWKNEYCLFDLIKKKERYKDLFRVQGEPSETKKISKKECVYDRCFYLTNVAFKSGYILPEEFIQEIRTILLEAESRRRPITRIVFSDLELLGVSYPLLKSSRTAGDLFLTAFVHIIRNYQKISLLMTGTTGQYSQADEMIGRARALADIVLKTSFCDVFGNRYIVLEGEGLTTRSPVKEMDDEKEYGEYSPGVIVPTEHRSTSTFEVDMDRMEGLVGFDTKNLHRPGVVFYAFEEGGIQRRYNEGIEDTLSYTFGLPRRRMNELFNSDLTRRQQDLLLRELGPDSRVYVEPFLARESEALHNSLTQLEGKPLNKTLISTVDEFALSKRGPGESRGKTLAEEAFIELGDLPAEKAKDQKYCVSKNIADAVSGKEGKRKDKICVWPYYRNVLMLVYRTKNNNGYPLTTPPLMPKANQIRSWEELMKFAKKLSDDLNLPYTGIEYFRYVEETLSCLLLDALVSGNAKDIRQDGEVPDSTSLSEEEGEKKEVRKWTDILFHADSLSTNQVNEIAALQHLLISSEEGRNKWVEQMKKNDEEISESIMSRKKNKYNSLQDEVKEVNLNSGVYILWYSQIREILETNPGLSDKLGICGLPGGGFSGDWYIGVSKGSVSKKLGKSMLKMLCSKKEQYKRFAQGVGLPIEDKFYDNKYTTYYSWPFGVDVAVGKLDEIHRAANTRRNIPDYPYFRNILTVICAQLICEKIQDKERIKENAGRIFKQIAMFRES